MASKGITLFRCTGTKTTQWNGWVEQRAGKVYMCTEFGQVGGKLQQSEREVLSTGNKGDYLTKATHDMEKKWRDKQDKEGYSPSQETVAAHSATHTITTVLPMLANSVVFTATQEIKNMALPCFVQAKIDGFRCVAHLLPTGTVELMSRTNIPYLGFATIRTALQALCTQLLQQEAGTFGSAGLYIDGELYIEGMEFNTLSGLIKRGQHHEDHDVADMVLVVFDCVDTHAITTPFAQRTAYLERLLAQAAPCLSKLDTQTVATAPAMREALARYIAQGYEGIMLRTLDGPYVLGKRSNHLLKYKLFEEKEFEIVSYKEGQGADSGTVVWECQTPGKQPLRFSVRPTGTHQARAAFFQDAHVYVGQFLTVKFQELSENGVPRFPVGKTIRPVFDFQPPAPKKVKKTK